jgi:hypothetical protein
MLKDEALSGTLDLAMQQVSLSSSGSLFEKYPSAKEALATVDAIDAKATLSGSLDAPGVAITSNLDRVLNKVFDKAIEGQLASYKAELTQRLETMLDEEMKGLKGAKSDYLSLSDDISGAEGALDKILGGL